MDAATLCNTSPAGCLPGGVFFVCAPRKWQELSLGALGGPRQYRELKQNVLDVLIDQQLLWQEAERKHLLVSDAEVKKALKAMRDSQPSEEAYLGKSEDLIRVPYH